MNKKNIRMAGIILGGVFIWMLLGLFAPSERKPEIRDVEKQTVLTINSEAQDYSLPISIQSISEAFSKVELRSQTSEKVKKINFLDGEFVEKDQVICELEPGQKYANFKKSEIQYESSKNLFDKGLISESGLVTSEASYEAAKVDYERTKIKATFNGFVEKLAKEGQLLQNGQLCASLISLSPLKIVGNVSELLVNKVKIGQNVHVTFLSGEGYKSNLTFISSSADKQTKTLQEFILKDNIKKFEFDIKLKIPGKHNALNAAAAFIVAQQAGIQTNIIKNSLKNFSGVSRRFEEKGTVKINGKEVLVVDDYGHHPTEIKSTIQAAKSKYRGKQINMIFQPHRYSRSSILFREFISVLSETDSVQLMDIYSAGEANTSGISSYDFVDSLLRKGIDAKYAKNLNQIRKNLNESIKKESILIIQGAGNVSDITASLMAIGKK